MRSIKILMFSWEYPPHAVGGLAKHVEELSAALSKKSVEVHVLTVGAKESPQTERKNNLWIHRVQPYPIEAPNFISWIQHLNFRFIEEAINLIDSWGSFDLIHCHDWLVSYAGKVIKNAYKLPLLATIHATEAGRNQGLYTADNHYINQMEWWLTYEAWKVIVCSRHMVQEVKTLFNLPSDKIKVIPNGIDLTKFQRPSIRNISFGPGKKVFFVGRLVKEKGVQVLLNAAPKVLALDPDVHFFIAGKGPMEHELKQLAKNLGIEANVHFLGYVDEEVKLALYKEAAVAVFPSLYEPFGIVALEGMAAGAPVIAADTGGLGEIIEHGVSGLKFEPGNALSLAENLIKLLENRELAQKIGQNALKLVQSRYGWEEIAEKTIAVYTEILKEYARSSWGKGKMVLPRKEVLR